MSKPKLIATTGLLAATVILTGAVLIQHPQEPERRGVSITVSAPATAQDSVEASPEPQVEQVAPQQRRAALELQVAAQVPEQGQEVEAPTREEPAVTVVSSAVSYEDRADGMQDVVCSYAMSDGTTQRRVIGVRSGPQIQLSCPGEPR